MEDSEARGEKARMEGYVRSDEGEAPGLVGERGSSFQVMRVEAWGIRTAPHHVV